MCCTTSGNAISRRGGSGGVVSRATTLTTQSVTSRGDESVGAGPRACPRDETDETPSRRRVAPSPIQHQRTHDAQHRSNASRSDDCETARRGVLGGSVHPGCRGQAGGPAPTGSSSRDVTYPVVGVVGRGSSLRDVTYPMVGVVGRGSSSRDVTYPVVGVVARGSSLHDASYPVVNVVAGTRRNMTIA